jgi:2'-5' RNA ligase
MRVFVAINPSEAERARLEERSRPLREAAYPVRWLPPENVHLTLKFLGEVAEEQVGEVTAAVSDAMAGVPAFEMTVSGFGAFPSAKRPGVVWAGIEADDALRDVYERVETALEPLGYPRESRPFRPHLTIGRGAKRAKPAEFRGLAEALAERSDYRDAFRVRAVETMRSRLMPKGAVYEVLKSAGLED